MVSRELPGARASWSAHAHCQPHIRGRSSAHVPPIPLRNVSLGAGPVLPRPSGDRAELIAAGFVNVGKETWAVGLRHTRLYTKEEYARVSCIRSLDLRSMLCETGEALVATRPQLCQVRGHSSEATDATDAAATVHRCGSQLCKELMNAPLLRLASGLAVRKAVQKLWVGTRRIPPWQVPTPEMALPPRGAHLMPYKNTHGVRAGREVRYAGKAKCHPKAMPTYVLTEARDCCSPDPRPRASKAFGPSGR